MKNKLKQILQEIEDMLKWRLVWDPESKKWKKMLVYGKKDLRSEEKNEGK